MASYLVERYLPGLDRGELQHSLERLKTVTAEMRREGTSILYLGSTIVPEDEACFCSFDAPTEAVVREASRRAGLSFDRIVSAVAVANRRAGTNGDESDEEGK
jgi:hypothetical protein